MMDKGALLDLLLLNSKTAESISERDGGWVSRVVQVGISLRGGRTLTESHFMVGLVGSRGGGDAATHGDTGR